MPTEHITLLYAAKRNDFELVEALIQAGSADCEEQDEQDDSTALHYAVRHGNTEMIRVLLAAGADGGKVTRHGDTAVFLAVLHNHWDCVLEFAVASRHTDFNDFDKTLLYAAKQNKTEVVEALLLSGSGCDNCDGRNGNTALHYAVLNDNEQMAYSLVNAGAEQSTVNSRGKTALELAIELQRDACLEGMGHHEEGRACRAFREAVTHINVLNQYYYNQLSAFYSGSKNTEIKQSFVRAAQSIVESVPESMHSELYEYLSNASVSRYKQLGFSSSATRAVAFFSAAAEGNRVGTNYYEAAMHQSSPPTYAEVIAMDSATPPSYEEANDLPPRYEAPF